MATLEVSFPFKHDGEWTKPGDTVELDDSAAAQRVKDGHGRIVEGKAGKPGKATAASASTAPASPPAG